MSIQKIIEALKKPELDLKMIHAMVEEFKCQWMCSTELNKWDPKEVMNSIVETRIPSEMPYVKLWRWIRILPFQFSVLDECMQKSNSYNSNTIRSRFMRFVQKVLVDNAFKYIEQDDIRKDFRTCKRSTVRDWKEILLAEQKKYDDFKASLRPSEPTED